MPDFSSVSPKNQREKMLSDIINSISTDADVNPFSYRDYLIQTIRGGMVSGHDFNGVKPKNQIDKLLSDIGLGTSLATRTPRNYAEKALQIIIDAGDVADLRNPFNYEEYLWYSLVDALSTTTHFRLLESGDFRLLEDDTSKRLKEAA